MFLGGIGVVFFVVLPPPILRLADIFIRTRICLPRLVIIPLVPIFICHRERSGFSYNIFTTLTSFFSNRIGTPKKFAQGHPVTPTHKIVLNCSTGLWLFELSLIIALTQIPVLIVALIGHAVPRLRPILYCVILTVVNLIIIEFFVLVAPVFFLRTKNLPMLNLL